MMRRGGARSKGKSSRHRCGVVCEVLFLEEYKVDAQVAAYVRLGRTDFAGVSAEIVHGIAIVVNQVG